MSFSTGKMNEWCKAVFKRWTTVELTTQGMFIYTYISLCFFYFQWNSLWCVPQAIPVVDYVSKSDDKMMKGNQLIGSYSEKPRLHAWHPPYQPRQVLPWITLASSFGCFFGLERARGGASWEAWTGVYVGLTGLMLLFGLCTTFLINPHVPINNKRNGTTECPQCSIKRTSTRTHHCSECNRCADDFDHRKIYISR